MPPHFDEVGHLALSADGQWVAFMGTKFTDSDLYRIGWNGDDLLLLAEDIHVREIPIFTPPLTLPWQWWLNGLVGVLLVGIGLTRRQLR